MIQPSISLMTIPARPRHATLADHFADAGASRHPLRLRLVSGEELDCHSPSFDVDQLVLVVTTYDGVVRRIPPGEIRDLYERRARWPAYAGLTFATVAVSVGISAFLVPLLSPLGAIYGAMIGALGGAAAASAVATILPSVIPFEYARLLDRLGSLAYWHAVLPNADTSPEPGGRGAPPRDDGTGA